jgi:ammonium transporter, Amt family
LVGITPAAGFNPVYAAVPIGAITSLTAFFVARYKNRIFKIDEGLDIFPIHGIGGVVGDILTGIFASKNVPAMDGVTTDVAGGWWDLQWKQVGIQIVAAITCAAWSFVISTIILVIINKIPGCRIRVTEEEELDGLDEIYLDDGPISGYAEMTMGGTSSDVVYGEEVSSSGIEPGASKQ